MQTEKHPRSAVRGNLLSTPRKSQRVVQPQDADMGQKAPDAIRDADTGQEKAGSQCHPRRRQLTQTLSQVRPSQQIRLWHQSCISP